MIDQQTTDPRLAEAVAPFARAARGLVRAEDDDAWLSTPEYLITVGDLRRLVALAATP